jgi:hypothetical protein
MNNNQSKTHYRKVFKSDHLGVADLEDLQENGSNLIFTIAYVKQEHNAKVAGKKIDANIAYFVEKIKPLVLNATNSKTMSILTSSCFVENWQNVPVQLYIDSGAKMKGQVVGGVRISPNPVRMQKQPLTPENEQQWANAKNAFKRDGNLNKVLAKMSMSSQHQSQLIQECKDV